MRRIYITHCSAKKDDSLRNTGMKVTPGKLYASTRLQCFVRGCKGKAVEWAIFSDKYGVVFPFERIEWYDKHPKTVTDVEFQWLVANFMQRLSGYDEVWFYHHPGRFHSLYRKLVERVRSEGIKIVLFKHTHEIG